MLENQNLVLRRTSDNKLLWTANLQGTGTDKACMQTDGNFITYTPEGSMWSTGTTQDPGAVFDVRDDGNLVVTNNAGAKLVWQSNTVTSCTGEKSYYQL